MKKAFLKAALAAAAVLVPASANATIIFNVNGTFAGGGTLTGTFSTNDAITVLESVNLTSTAFGTNTFTSVASGSLSVLPLFMQFNLSSPLRQLNIIFTPTLSATGGTIAAGSYEAQGNLGNFRALSGTVTASPAAAAVPEPATWAMMLLGFGAIGVGMRSRTRQTVRLKLA
jgi:hypothetical protein